MYYYYYYFLKDITIVASPKGELGNFYNFSLYVESNTKNNVNLKKYIHNQFQII